MTRAKNSWLHLAFRSAGLFGQSGGSLANRNRPAFEFASSVHLWRNACLSLLEKQKRLEVNR